MYLHKSSSKAITGVGLYVVLFPAVSRLRALRQAVQRLMEVARRLNSRRTSQGALELESSEVTVQMAESQEIKDLIPKQVCVCQRWGGGGGGGFGPGLWAEEAL